MNLTESQLREGALKSFELAIEQFQATVPAKKAAIYLGFSYWKLLEMVKAKKIPCIKVGNRLLFRLASLDAWLAQQEVASTAEPEPVGKIRKLK